MSDREADGGETYDGVGPSPLESPSIRSGASGEECPRQDILSWEGGSRGGRHPCQPHEEAAAAGGPNTGGRVGANGVPFTGISKRRFFDEKNRRTGDADQFALENSYGV